MQDRFGREITINPDGTFAAGGITVDKLETLNAMAPEGWVEPVPEDQ